MQGSADIELYNVSAQGARVISTFLAVWKNASVKNFFQAAHWRSHNTFTDLKDMASERKLEHDRAQVHADRLVLKD
jgi:hypothetical protein